MSKSVWTSGFRKPLVHKNMSNFWNNIFKFNVEQLLGVINAIKWSAETVMEFNTFLSKLVTMGSDGASVMLGKKSGVLALLKEQQPSLIGIYCSAHRLELYYKDAMKKVPMAEKVLTLLTGLYYMYRNSPLNRTNLKNAFRCLSINIKLPTRAGGTRWVGHILRALEHFLDGYPAFRLHLEQLAASKEKSDGKAKAIGFLKLLRSQDIIAMALFLQDILTVLHKVSFSTSFMYCEHITFSTPYFLHIVNSKYQKLYLIPEQDKRFQETIVVALAVSSM